jgi:hypothetical protein
MSKLNKLILLTIICNMFIVVGIGHGVSPIGIVEFMYLGEALDGRFTFSLSDDYESRLPGSALSALPGQVILLISGFLNRHIKNYFIYLGLAILFFSFLFLNVSFLPLGFTGFLILFNVPFIVAAIMLLVFTIKTSNRLKMVK